jgi:hypothetical protein
MKGLIGIAVVLGIAGTVLGAIALMDEGGDDGGGFESQTLTLTGGEEERIPFAVEHIDESHPLGNEGWTTHREVSGDASGEWVVVCTPIAGDHVHCNGAAILEDGELEIEGTEPAADDGQATSAIVGGTGDYKGAIGEVDIDFENDEYTLDFLIPEDS